MVSKKNNLLLRFYNVSVGKYGEPFSICRKDLKVWKPFWSSRGLVIEQMGTTEWECGSHGVVPE